MENENIKNNELVNVTEGENNRKEKRQGIFSRVFRFIGRLVKKGNRNYFNISKKGKEPMRINLTITVLFFLFTFWFSFFLAVAGLILGYRYHIEGPDFEGKDINDYFDKAASTADGIRNDFKEGYKNS